MKKKKKCTKAISRGGIVRSLPPYARAMRFANRPIVSRPARSWTDEKDNGQTCKARPGLAGEVNPAEKEKSRAGVSTHQTRRSCPAPREETRTIVPLRGAGRNDE